MLDERIQIPHYAVGWGGSCSAKLGVQCSYGGSILERDTKEPSKKSEGVMGNLSLYLACDPPSTSLATVLAKRIGPSLADRSRVELALLPRLSLTRFSRTQSLFLFGRSFVLHSFAITRRERSNQGAYYHIERSKA